MNITMALVFEKNEKVFLAEVIDPSKYVLRSNLKNIVLCPPELLENLPKKLVNYCKEKATSYLRINSDRKWEITTE